MELNEILVLVIISLKSFSFSGPFGGTVFLHALGFLSNAS